MIVAKDYVKGMKSMKNIKDILSVGIFAFVALFLALSPVASAASSEGNGMRVSPVRTDLVVQPGSSKIVSVYVRNVTKVEERLKVLVNDFVASKDESGAPALLLNGEANDQHGLKKYVTTQDTVVVAPGTQQEVKVAIKIPTGTAGGGYYGAIRFAPFSGSGDNANVSLSGSVASLILVRVPGDVKEKVTLVSFDARQGKPPHDVARTVFTSNKDIKATVRFQNEGNIQEQPFGKVLLKKGDTVVKEYEINHIDQPANVLPDSIRKFQIQLKELSSFGKYTLEGNFGYGTTGQLITAKTTFYIIPVYIIVLGLIILALILFLIFGLPRVIRNYNKRVLRKAGRR